MKRSIWTLFFAILLQACGGDPTVFFKTDSSYKPRPSISFNKPSVKRDGKEWLQPSMFTKLSVSKVSNICNKGGHCTGTLNGHDVTGYIWASTSDITALYKSYGAQPGLCKEGESLSATQCLTGATWYSRVMADFQPTNPQNSRKRFVIKTFTDCSEKSKNKATCNLIFMYIGKVLEAPQSIVSKPLDYVISQRFTEQGVFLYRPYTPLNTPVYSEKRNSSVTPNSRVGTSHPQPFSAPDSQ